MFDLPVTQCCSSLVAMSLLHVVTTGLDPVVNADVRRIKRCGNSSAAGEPHGLPGQLTPKTALRALCPAMTKYKMVLATLSCVRALRTAATPKINSLPANKEGSGAPKGAMPSMSELRKQVYAVAPLICYAAARPESPPSPACGRRSGRGHAHLRRSRLRHSPPAITPMAQPQNRVSRRRTSRVFCPLGPLAFG